MQDMYSDVASLNMLSTATKGLQSLQELQQELSVIAKNHPGYGMSNR